MNRRLKKDKLFQEEIEQINEEFIKKQKEKKESEQIKKLKEGEENFNFNIKQLQSKNNLLEEELVSRSKIIGQQENELNSKKRRIVELEKELNELKIKKEEKEKKEEKIDYYKETINKLEKFVVFLYSELTNYINMNNNFLLGEKAKQDLFTSHVNKFNEDWNEFLEERTKKTN